LHKDFSIGRWIVHPGLNAISSDSETTHLEPKVMQVLLRLASRHSQVVSKNTLISEVWPDTFVSDDALTRCISLLRREMGDDPHTPRYIQTIPKVGYRLIAEVRPIEIAEDEPKTSALLLETPVSLAPPLADSAESHETPDFISPPSELPNASVPKSAIARHSILWKLLAAIALLAGVSFASLLWGTHRQSSVAFRVIPLTSYAGQQDQAAFSPDGSRIAFVWTKTEDGSRNVFIKQIGSETLLRLTNGNEMDYSPAWSPDGSQIAFRAISEHGSGIFLVSSLGGQPQKVYTLLGPVQKEQAGLSWSPDGKRLIFADGFSENSPSSIYELSLDTMQAHAITAPPRVWDGDLNPVFSPDGRKIAFLRGIEGLVRDIYVVSASGGEPKQITRDERIIDSLAWTPDNASIIFSSDRGGKFALWKASARGGEPERLPVGDEDAYQPAISAATRRLLFTESSATWSIVGFPLSSNGRAGKPIAVVSSTQQDSAPSFAPDGSRFAFQSWRSGAQDLWIASRDGLNLLQLTSSGFALTGSPAFSPDGQQVAFDGRPDGHSHIFVVPAGGGSQQQLTFGNSNDILPRWSVDGQYLYFASNRNGGWQSWKVAVRGGQLQQVTTNGGYLAMESPDRQWVYYTKADAPGIWRVPIGGGPEVRILSQPRTGYWGYWSVTNRGIYLLDNEQAVPRIVLYDPVAGKITPVITLDQQPPPYSGISVSSNEDELLITDERNAGSHITLVEDFPR